MRKIQHRWHALLSLASLLALIASAYFTHRVYNNFQLREKLLEEKVLSHFHATTDPLYEEMERQSHRAVADAQTLKKTTSKQDREKTIRTLIAKNPALLEIQIFEEEKQRTCGLNGKGDVECTEGTFESYREAVEILRQVEKDFQEKVSEHPQSEFPYVWALSKYLPKKDTILSILAIKLDKPGTYAFLVYSFREPIEMVKRLDFGLQSHARIVTAKKVPLFPTTKGWIQREENRILKRHFSKYCKTLFAKSTSGKTHICSLFDLKKVLLFSQIGSTDIAVEYIVSEDDILPLTAGDQQLHLITAICIALFLCFSALLLVRVYSGKAKQLIWGSIFASFVVILLIGYCIFFLPTVNPNPGISLETQSRILANITDSPGTQQSVEKIAIPTSIYFNSIELMESQTAGMTGFFIQSFPKGHKPDSDPDFVIPSIVPGSPYQVKLVKKVQRPYDEIFIWSFDVVVKQPYIEEFTPFNQFTLSFPFFNQNRAKNHEYVFIPSKNHLSSHEMLGIEESDGSNIIPAWTLKKSNYTYGSKKGFENGRIFNELNTNELIFNLVFSESILGSFAENLFPYLLNSILIFAILALPLAKGASSMKSSLGMLTTVALVITFQSNSSALGFTRYATLFLDIYGLLLFILTILVLVDLIRYLTKSKVYLLDYRNNLIAKLMYWPLLSLTLFFVILTWIL